MRERQTNAHSRPGRRARTCVRYAMRVPCRWVQKRASAIFKSSLFRTGQTLGLARPFAAGSLLFLILPAWCLVAAVWGCRESAGEQAPPKQNAAPTASRVGRELAEERVQPTLAKSPESPAAANAHPPQFSWQDPHAKVLDTGDLVWNPKPFLFEKGASLKYIDFDAGSDDNPGTKDQPWKHHPWDANATGQAKAGQGLQTYVFKRGVAYRGTLAAKESGQPNNPICLTSDPAWGTGEAAIYGSVKAPGSWKKCTPADAPAAPLE
jgi:hypothetical protein